MHGTCLTFGKPFVRKQYKVLVFLIVSAESVEVPIELSEDCCCNLSAIVTLVERFHYFANSSVNISAVRDIC